MKAVRIDKWLWAARLYRTRSLALEACRAGHVKTEGSPVKPGKPVRQGEIIEAQTAGPLRTVRVLKVIEKRVGAKLVPEVLEELTPREEFERARKTVVEQVLSRPKGTGRPTKRDRRLIDKLLP